MRPVALSQIARWCEGRLLGDDREIAAVSTDTRAMPRDSLFIALRGENFDAHDFIDQAEAAGRRGLLVSRPVESALPKILCADTEEALGEFAAGMQQGRSAVVVALTGSNGKTSVKTLLQGILSRAGRTYLNPAIATMKSACRWRCSTRRTTRIRHLRDGRRQAGRHRYLASIVPPQVALVNNIAPAHLDAWAVCSASPKPRAHLRSLVRRRRRGDQCRRYLSRRSSRRSSASAAVSAFGIDNDADVRATKSVPVPTARSSPSIRRPATRTSPCPCPVGTA
jgi:UDP-N-acetylmuramoyl-tripeptide--D-alanyl-D-alanine ligase